LRGQHFEETLLLLLLQKFQKIRKEDSLEIDAMWVEPDHSMAYTEHFLNRIDAE